MVDNLVRIGKRQKMVDPDRTLETVRSRECRHPRFTIDESLNNVSCSVCNAELNPIWVLAKLATKDSLLAQSRDRLSALVKKMGNKTKYKCRSCGKMNDMSRIVKVSSQEHWEASRSNRVGASTLNNKEPS